MKENLVKIVSEEGIKITTTFGELKNTIKKDLSEKFRFDVVNWRVEDGNLHCKVMVYDAFIGDITKFVKYVVGSKSNHANSKINIYKEEQNSGMKFEITEMEYLLSKLFDIKENGYFRKEVKVNGVLTSKNKMQDDDVLTFYYNLEENK